MIVYCPRKKIRETEKAIQFATKIDTRDMLSIISGADFGIFYGEREGEKFWVPKSIILDECGDFLRVKWWKFRGRDLIKNMERWPGIRVAVLHEGTMSEYVEALYNCGINAEEREKQEEEYFWKCIKMGMEEAIKMGYINEKGEIPQDIMKLWSEKKKIFFPEEVEIGA